MGHTEYDGIYRGRGSLSHRGLNRLLHDHYLQRKPPMTDTFEWVYEGDVVGVLTLGVPASRHVQISACPTDPNMVVELNRLWLADSLPHGSASWFIGQCFRQLGPLIVVSYADTAVGHNGGVYRASNFHYAGWTDMERKSPRFDYVTPGKHPRDTFRNGLGTSAVRVPRKPKAKYWAVTGARSDKRRLTRLCGWPIMSWRAHPAPAQHEKYQPQDTSDE